MASRAYTISMPEDLMHTIDEFAAGQHRTRSEFLREAARRCMEPPQVYEVSAWLRQLYDLYAPAREEIRALGLSEEDIGKIIDEEIAAYREEKRAKGRV